MATGKELTPTEYIGHHLTHGVHKIGDGGFWTLNFDSIAVAILLGFVGIGSIWWVVRGATSGVPNKRQAFVELLFTFVDDQAKSIFRHGDRNSFIAPTALTVFVWVLLMNSMDFLPVDIVAWGTHKFTEHGFRIVPTADVNTTFALALTVFALMIFFSIKVKGLDRAAFAREECGRLLVRTPDRVTEFGGFRRRDNRHHGRAKIRLNERAIRCPARPADPVSKGFRQRRFSAATGADDTSQPPWELHDKAREKTPGDFD